MRLLLANPAGLLALLSVPAILLIHFLQERSRRVRVSTLFLLERVAPRSVAGSRVEKLRNSVPLWLQLAAALLVTWMLAEPRWIRQDSRQTVVVVMDSSVSMCAFREETRRQLEQSLRDWSRAAAHTEWHLLESDPRKPTLYAGPDLAGVLRGFDSWQPTRGSHRPDDALLIARGLVKTNGIVIFVTDRKLEAPSDVALLSAAGKMQNTGFAGAEIQSATVAPGTAAATKWRVLVRNYGDEVSRREWWVEFPGSGEASKKNPVEILPGQTVTLTGELPPDIERAVLVLSGDKFTWDDRLPVQKPRPRLVRAEVRFGGRVGDLWRKMLGALDQVEVLASASVQQPPDLVISELGTALNGPGIQLPLEGTEEAQLDGAWTVAEDHPLVRDVNWMGLLTTRPLELAVTENDEPLLWKGDRPLALVRRTSREIGTMDRRLLLAWDLAQSNAARHPAMLVLVHRFVEDVRQSLHTPWAGNFEAGQPLHLADAARKEAASLQLSHANKKSRYDGRLPEEVGFFEVTEGGKALVSGSLQFADTREADFADAAPVDTVQQHRWDAALRQTEADPFTALWVFLVLGCLLVSWAWKQQGRARQKEAALLRPATTIPT